MTIPYGTDYTCKHGEPPDDCSKCEAEGDELHRSQLRMARRLATAYGDRLRYAHGLGWLEWDGARWRRERDGASMRAAVEMVGQAAREGDGQHSTSTRKGSHPGKSTPEDNLVEDVRRVETAAGLRGILEIARSLRPLAIAADRLDANPYLVNLRNGTLDLRTGSLRPHDPADLLTKVTGCVFNPAADGPTFTKFLAEVLPDPDVRDFVQRLFGYALLGRVTEHVLPIFTGVGCNGKSTLVEQVLRTFGDYAIAADPELLVEQRFSQHPTGQADLQGVRLAVTQETDEGRRLAAATVKRLTGGDKIRARRMRQDFFEFDPSHTVVMVTNHRPRVSGDDAALWRRIRVVPFDVVITDPDPALPARLQEEVDAVFAWAADGWLAYQRDGLAAPVAVTERTTEYRASSDAIGRFLAERTHTSTFAHARARELFGAWSAWCHGCGEPAGSEVTFAEALARRGFDKRKSGGCVTYVGLGLLAEDSDE